MLPLRPERGSSCSAPSPPLIYRRLHFATWLWCMLTCCPIPPFLGPPTVRFALSATTLAGCSGASQLPKLLFSAEFHSSFPRCLDIETSKHFLLRLSLRSSTKPSCRCWR